MAKRVRNKKLQYPFMVLANDPSMTAWGWVVLDANTNKIHDKGCIKTSSENKVRRIRKGDDTVRRIQEINYILIDIIQKNNIKCIVSELPHGSQNAQAAVMLGLVTGIAQTLSDVLHIPIDWFSEADAKKCLLNKKSATKKETIDAIDKIYKVQWTGVKYKDEAIADALSVYHVAHFQNSFRTTNYDYSNRF